MFLSLSASRCKAQSKLFSESCRVPAVLKESETKGRKLQEPQIELTQFTTRCTSRWTAASLWTVLTVPWAPVSTNRQECPEHSTQEDGTEMFKVLCFTLHHWSREWVFIFWISIPKEIRAHLPTGCPQSWEFAMCHYSQVAISLDQTDALH